MKQPGMIEKHQDQLLKLCRQYRVDKLYAFGSVVTDKFDENTSDIDLMVVLQPMPPIKKGETLINLWDALELLFNRSVDLLTDQPIKNQFLHQRIEQTKHLIYNRGSKKILI